MRNPVRLSKLLVVLFSVAVLSFAGSSAFGQQGDNGKKKAPAEGTSVTLKGEVLDLYCYMRHPDKGQGAGHAKCAKTCIRKGMPIGFLSDGVVYLILGQNHEPATELVVDFAGTQAQLTGKVVEHHGLKSVEIEKIEKP